VGTLPDAPVCRWLSAQRKAEQVTARLIVRRLNADVAQGQGELFTTWRYHPVFTDTINPNRYSRVKWSRCRGRTMEKSVTSSVAISRMCRRSATVTTEAVRNAQAVTAV
jgi:hypothetical protein